MAAKQCAIAKGLGYRGVYIGGHLKADDYLKVLSITKSYGTEDWREFAKEIQFSQPSEFYFFEANRETTLSSNELNHKYLASKSPEVLEESRKRVPLSYKINRMAHDKVFEKKRL